MAKTPRIYYLIRLLSFQFWSDIWSFEHITIAKVSSIISVIQSIKCRYHCMLYSWRQWKHPRGIFWSGCIAFNSGRTLKILKTEDLQESDSQHTLYKLSDLQIIASCIAVGEWIFLGFTVYCLGMRLDQLSILAGVEKFWESWIGKNLLWNKHHTKALVYPSSDARLLQFDKVIRQRGYG